MSIFNFNMRDTILVVMITVLLFISPLLYVGVLRDPSNLPRYAFLAGIICASFIVFSYFSFRNRVVHVYYSSVTLFAIGYLVLAGISGLWAVEPSNHLVYFVQLTCLVFLFFFVTQIASIGSIKIFIFISLISAGITAFIGIIQNYGYNLFDLRSSAMGGTFTYKNHTALYLDLIIPAGIVITLLSKIKILKWVSASALTICCIYVVTSHTRGSYLAMLSVLMALLILCIIFPNIRKNIGLVLNENNLILLIIVVIITLVSLIPGKADRFLDRPAYENDKIDTSTRDRLTAYSNALHLIKEKPLFGSGYGTFWKAFRPYTNHPKIILRSDENIVLFRLHNDILQIFVELGVIGGLLFISILFGALLLSIKMLRNKLDITEQLLIIGILLSLLGSFVHSLVDFPFLKPSSAIQIWLYLGLIVGLYAAKNKQYYVIQSTSIKALITVASAIITMAAVLFYHSFLFESYYAYIAEKNFKNKNCAETINYIDKAVNVFPHDFFTHKNRVLYHVSCNTNTASLYGVLNKELRWDDSNVLALMKRGHIYLDSHWLDEAERDFKRVSFLLPHRPTGYIGESLVLISRGNYEEAQALLDKLIKKFPKNEEVKNAIQKLQTEKNHLQ